MGQLERKKTTEQFQKELDNKFGKQFVVLGEYINNRTPIRIYHTKCKKFFTITPAVLVKNGKCKNCREPINKKTTESFAKEVKEKTNGEYELIGEYINSKTKVPILHHKCGKTYYILPSSFSAGHRCPNCSMTYKALLQEDYKNYDVKEYETLSKMKEELLGFIQDVYSGEIIENDRKILDGKEIDILLPEKHIGIEFDGLFFHSTFYNKSPTYHLSKTKLAKEKGIRLIHIFEDEWIYKQDIVKDKLKHILGVNSNSRIFARKTKISEIPPSERNKFLDKNHIQGRDGANISLGMFYNNELIGVMSFCKPRINMGQKRQNDDKEYELSRYATKLGYSVIGGFSKMLKYAITHYDVNEIYTYADLRWTAFENNMYDKNGFELVSISDPNYFYTSGKNRRENRFKYRKSELKKIFPQYYKDELSEKDITELAGLYRIYDCGNLKYKYNLRKEE